MHHLDITAAQPEPKPRRWTKALAGGLAAAVLLGSVAPTLAAPGNTHRAGFHHHFYRGQQLHAVGRHAANLGYSAASFGYGAGVLGLGLAGAAVGSAVDAAAMTADAEPWDESVAYCADRFKSYDPSTGTYLGYDGREHACP